MPGTDIAYAASCKLYDMRDTDIAYAASTYAASTGTNLAVCCYRALVVVSHMLLPLVLISQYAATSRQPLDGVCDWLCWRYHSRMRYGTPRMVLRHLLYWPIVCPYQGYILSGTAVADAPARLLRPYAISRTDAAAPSRLL
eukprot:2184336-Rhodomonas_salina.4